MQSGYKLDGSDIASTYGVYVIKAKGYMDLPPRKGVIEHDWEDEDGVQAFTDLSDIFYGPRDITLQCYIKAATKAAFLNQLNNFRRVLTNPGIHTLKLPYSDIVYRVYYRERSTFEILTTWSDSKLVGTFYVPLREPKPICPNHVQVIFISEVGTTNVAGSVKGTSGKAIRIDWGDGNIQNLTLNGNDQAISHDYGVAGNFTIAFSGDLQNLLTIDLHDQELSQFYLPNALTILNILYLYGTNVTGAIKDLSVFTALTDLRLYTTGITGDIKDIETLTSLVTLHIYSSSVVDYTSTTIPGTWNNILIQDLTLSATEVDNFLIDLDTAAGEDGTLNIAGSNAARTGASDAAKASLIAKGWGITVNE